MMQQIGLLFGSFNPIHIGHLAIANYTCEFSRLDEVWLVVTPHNPLKMEHHPADAAHRMEMCRLAIKSYPKFRICDIEYSLPSPSYTIDTLRTLQERYPQHRFKVIIGYDNWLQLPVWKDYKLLLKTYEWLVYPRRGDNPSPAKIEISAFPTAQFVPAPCLDISSSFIRQAFADGMQLNCFMPPAVFEYIIANKLYLDVPL
jgi:nicotinate-nucleotide adenylyltransferase